MGPRCGTGGRSAGGDHRIKAVTSLCMGMCREREGGGEGADTDRDGVKRDLDK